MRKKILVVSIALLACLIGLGAFHQFAPRNTPRGQPPLARIDSESFHGLRDAFNAAEDSTRVLLLLSPT